MRDVIARIVDGSRFREFKKEYGTTIITASVSLPHVDIPVIHHTFPGICSYSWISCWHCGQQPNTVFPICSESDSFHPALLSEKDSSTLSRERDRYVTVQILDSI